MTTLETSYTRREPIEEQQIEAYVSNARIWKLAGKCLLALVCLGAALLLWGWR